MCHSEYLFGPLWNVFCAFRLCLTFLKLSEKAYYCRSVNLIRHSKLPSWYKSRLLPEPLSSSGAEWDVGPRQPSRLRVHWSVVMAKSNAKTTFSCLLPWSESSSYMHIIVDFHGALKKNYNFRRKVSRLILLMILSNAHMYMKKTVS